MAKQQYHSNEPKVFTEKEIKQKMAGYKSNYQRKINQASGKNREFLKNHMEEYISSCLNRLMEANKKAIQIRAGYRSWETRRTNNHLVASKNNQQVVIPENPHRNRYSSSISASVINKKK